MGRILEFALRLWLITSNDFAESADVALSSSLFHSSTVFEMKYRLLSVVLHKGTTNLCLVISPHEALSFLRSPNSSKGIATSSCKML